MDTKIKKYIKREFYKGKGLPARLLDSIFFKIMVFLGLFILFFVLKTGIIRAIVLALTITTSSGILKFVFNRTRLISFSKKRIDKAKNDCMLERLILLNTKYKRALFKKVILSVPGFAEGSLTEKKGGYISDTTFCYAFKNHPKYPVNIEQVTDVCRSMRELELVNSLLISASGFDKDAQAMAVRRSEKCKLIGETELSELLKTTLLYPSNEDAYEYLSGEIEEQRITREKLKDAVFDADKGKAFAVVALVLAVWPLIGEFSIVYPIAAVICGSLAFYGFIRSFRKKKSSSHG